MASKIRYMFLRDDNKVPCGCLAIKLHRKKEYLEYQVSVLNPMDRFHPLTGKQMPFNREMARLLSAGRLVENPFRVKMPKEATMTEISILVMTDLASLLRPSARGDVPARAIKAAKLWLRSHSE